MSGLAKRAKNEVTNKWSESKIKKDLPDFKAAVFEEEAKQVYLSFYKHFATGETKERRLSVLTRAGDVSSIRQLVTPKMLEKVKARLDKRRQSKKSYGWEGEVTAIKTMTVRHLPVDEFALNFAQICCRINAKHRVQRDGKDNESDVEEHWVFERATNKQDERWRWCATLPLEAGQSSLMELQAAQQNKD